MKPITSLVPQRFRYGTTKKGDGPTKFGCCIPFRAPNGWRWYAVIPEGLALFDADPWESLGQLIGDAKWFEWIDNAHGWHE